MCKKLMRDIIITFMLVIAMAVTGSIKADASGVSDYGALKVSGTKLVSSKTGENAVLRGVSTHGINWDVGYPYISREAFSTLKDKR